MNFNFPLLRPIRILLFPFSLLYALVVVIRNRLYDKNILSSASFNLPIICVGNLSVGGTGKSPMVELMVANLKDQFRVAVLSRGYKRKTRGYALANEQSTALEIGDEPMQFHTKFPDIPVAVGEERLVAIPQLLHDRPDTEAIILDDAFQHRSIKAGFNILLTECANLFTRDWFLPTGDLRDERSAYKRAQLIVVTKCPDTFSTNERTAITQEIDPLPHQHVFFTSLQYGQPYHLVNGYTHAIAADEEVLLVTGIANPNSLKQHLAERADVYFQMAYNDHHIFTIDDVKDIRKRFDSLTGSKKIIITTEKDATRLKKLESQLSDLPIFVLPISHRFLFDEAQSFLLFITNFINTFKR